jgi:predicted membrane-bound spermidine synthase
MNAQINRLYTVEAFQAIRDRLAPLGLVAFTIPSSENYLSPDTAYFNAALYHTVRSVFPVVELVAGDPLLLLASRHALRLDPAELARRSADRHLVTREVVPSYFPVKLEPRRRAALVETLSRLHPPLNRDFFPACYAYAWRAWLAKFVSPIYFLGTLALFVTAAWLLRFLWRGRGAFAVRPAMAALWALGAAGMVYEAVLLLAFQSIHGYIAWQLGSLFAAFMLGLALGSALAVRRLARLDPPRAARALRFLLVLTGLEGLALAWILPGFQRVSIQIPWLVPFGLLLLVSGFWLGLAFPIASRLAAGPDGPARVAGSLYAADLWGAALGAVLTSALLVPLMGFVCTLLVTGFALCLAAWMLPS